MVELMLFVFLSVCVNSLTVFLPIMILTLGYISNDVIMQNAVSFMPSIILSVIVSCIVSTKIANPYLTMMMKSFGIMKTTFNVPVTFIILMEIGFIIISFIFAYLLSRKIRKIEAYNLLRGE